MALTGWPFFDDRLRLNEELWKAFSPLLRTRSEAQTAGVFPSVNIYDDGQAMMVRAEIPGANRESLEVTTQEDQLTLRGERKIATPGPNANYHRREREEGQFRRVVTLPYSFDAEKIRATYQNGVLEVVLPRAPESLPRQIPIQ